MGNTEILAVKVKKVAERLKRLTDENLKLKLEVEYLKKENELGRKQAGRYTVLRKNADEAATKIEKIIKKIDTAKVS
jgi:septation ring formation regulator EzrA